METNQKKLSWNQQITHGLGVLTTIAAWVSLAVSGYTAWVTIRKHERVVASVFDRGWVRGQSAYVEWSDDRDGIIAWDATIVFSNLGNRPAVISPPSFVANLTKNHSKGGGYTVPRSWKRVNMYSGFILLNSIDNAVDSVLLPGQVTEVHVGLEFECPRIYTEFDVTVFIAVLDTEMNRIVQSAKVATLTCTPSKNPDPFEAPPGEEVRGIVNMPSKQFDVIRN